MTISRLWACDLFIVTTAFGAASRAQAQDPPADPVADLLAPPFTVRPVRPAIWKTPKARQGRGPIRRWQAIPR